MSSATQAPNNILASVHAQRPRATQAGVRHHARRRPAGTLLHRSASPRLAQKLYAKAQLAPHPSIERYVAQLFGALPWVEGGALVLDAHQDALLVALTQHTQDQYGNGTRDRAVADQLALLLTLALARRPMPADEAWVDIQTFADERKRIG